MDSSANLIAEMRFKLTTSLSVAAMLVAVAACGSSEDSRTRNAALAPCSGSAVESASRELIARQKADVEELDTVFRTNEVFVTSAKFALDEARNAGTKELTQAVKNFDTAEAVFTMVDAQIKEWKTDGYWESMGSMMNDLWVRELASANANLITAKAEMERLLVQKATAIGKAVDAYNNAVKKRDESLAAYTTAAESYNKVILISSGRNCPVLSAGDAETYVREAASTIPPTTVQRRVFQFIDEPAPTTIPQPGGQVDEASNGDNGGSSPSETTIPVTTPPDETDTDSTSTTTAPSDGAGNDITVDTLPIPVAPTSVEYGAPTAAEIIENISELFSALDRDSPESEQNTVVVAEIFEQLNDLSKKISSGEISITNDQLNIVSTQLTSLLFIVVVSNTKKKKTDYDSSSSSSVSKLSVSVSASGFSPGSDVIFANRSGRPLRNLKASDGGVAVFDVDVDATADRDLFMLGGKNSAGDVVAVPVLVEFDENANTDTSTTIAAENTSTASTVVDVDDNESGGDGSGTPWILWLLLVAALLAIAYGIRKQLTKRTNDAK